MNHSLVQRRGASLLLLASTLMSHFVSAQNVADNIRPVGSICMTGQACVGEVAGAMAEASAVDTAEPVVEAEVVEAATVPEMVEEAAVEPAADNSEVLQLAQVSDGFNPEQKYMASCFACHSTGAAGAPKVGAGMMNEWEPRLEKGLDAVVANAINGVNAMPAKGLCFDCNEDDIRALVEYMLETSQ